MSLGVGAQKGPSSLLFNLLGQFYYFPFSIVELWVVCSFKGLLIALSVCMSVWGCHYVWSVVVRGSHICVTSNMWRYRYKVFFSTQEDLPVMVLVQKGVQCSGKSLVIAHVEGGAQHPRGHLITVRMVSKAKQTNTNLPNIILTRESMNMSSKDQDQERSSFSTSICYCMGKLVNAIGQDKEIKTHRLERRKWINSIHRYRNCLCRKPHGTKTLTTNGIS